MRHPIASFLQFLRAANTLVFGHIALVSASVVSLLLYVVVKSPSAFIFLTVRMEFRTRFDNSLISESLIYP